MNRSQLEVDPATLHARLAQPDPPVVVDVREAWEVDRCPFPTAVHIPLGELADRAPQELLPSAETVVVCHHGVRSLHATLTLRALGFTHVRSLQGGTDLYSQTVDPTLPRY